METLVQIENVRKIYKRDEFEMAGVDHAARGFEGIIEQKRH